MATNSGIFGMWTRYIDDSIEYQTGLLKDLLKYTEEKEIELEDCLKDSMEVRDGVAAENYLKEVVLKTKELAEAVAELDAVDTEIQSYQMASFELTVRHSEYIIYRAVEDWTLNRRHSSYCLNEIIEVVAEWAGKDGWYEEMIGTFPWLDDFMNMYFQFLGRIHETKSDFNKEEKKYEPRASLDDVQNEEGQVWWGVEI